MNALAWHKTGRNWTGIEGKYRATVLAPDPDETVFRFWYWSVDGGNSGGTHSVLQAKRAAQEAVDRMKTRAQNAPRI